MPKSFDVMQSYLGGLLAIRFDRAHDRTMFYYYRVHNQVLYAWAMEQQLCMEEPATQVEFGRYVQHKLQEEAGLEPLGLSEEMYDMSEVGKSYWYGYLDAVHDQNALANQREGSTDARKDDQGG